MALNFSIAIMHRQERILVNGQSPDLLLLCHSIASGVWPDVDKYEAHYCIPCNYLI